MLSEDALLSARVVISVIGNDSVVEPGERGIHHSLRYAAGPRDGGVGKKVRTFSEGLIELDDRDDRDRLWHQLPSRFPWIPRATCFCGRRIAARASGCFGRR